MNISIIGMPLFYGCDNPGVEKGPEELRKNNLIDIFEKNHTVCDLGDIEVTDEMLDLLDVLIDGPFMWQKKNLRLMYRGSENQRVIDLKKTRKEGKVVLLIE